jgi:hypothetical protein
MGHFGPEAGAYSKSLFLALSAIVKDPADGRATPAMLKYMVETKRDVRRFVRDNRILADEWADAYDKLRIIEEDVVIEKAARNVNFVQRSIPCRVPKPTSRVPKVQQTCICKAQSKRKHLLPLLRCVC